MSPELLHLHIWMILLIYPTLCRTMLDTFRCSPLGDAYYLNIDTRVRCYDEEWIAWAIVSIIFAILYALGLPAIIFWLTYRYHNSKPAERGALGRHISLLLNSYRDRCWWFETVDMLRKFLLTSVVLIVGPRTTVQIWFGLLMSTIATLVVVKVEPYVDVLCGRLQTAATMQIMFNYMMAVVFYTPIGTTNPASEATQGYFGTILLVVNLAMFIILFATIGRGGVKAAKAPRARWLHNDWPVRLPTPSQTLRFHVFISHVWSTGQDQAKTLKMMFLSLVPSMRCFLDVDECAAVIARTTALQFSSMPRADQCLVSRCHSLRSLDELECYVEGSSMLLVFLSGSVDARTGQQHSDVRQLVSIHRPLGRSIPVLPSLPAHSDIGGSRPPSAVL